MIFNKWKFKKSASSTFCGFHKAALLEMNIAFSLINLAAFWTQSEARFQSLTPHPFWFVILLITVQYGTLDGIAAVFLGTAFLYIGNMPMMKPDETLFTYEMRIIQAPFLWFLTAFILGEVRSRIATEREEYKELYQVAKRQADTITRAYQELKTSKENLERHIAGEQITTAAIYQAFSALGTLNPSRILLQLESVVTSSLHPNKFSIYSFGSHGFEAATCYGWTDSDSFQRRYPPGDPLYERLIEKPDVITVVNKDDQKILGKEGILAAPLIDSDKEEIFGMLKIEDIGLVKLNFSNLEVFKNLCHLIGRAYSNARQFKQSEQSNIHFADTEALSPNLLYVAETLLLKICEKAKIPLVHIDFFICTELYLSKEEKNQGRKDIISYLTPLLPEEALLFKAKGSADIFSIFLPFYTVEEGKAAALNWIHSIQKGGRFPLFNLSIKASVVKRRKKGDADYA